MLELDGERVVPFACLASEGRMDEVRRQRPGERESPAMTRRRYTLERFQVLNDFVDHGLADLSRSEVAVYLILFRDTQPTGLARTSLTELARRGGMSERQASRALNKLIQRGAVHVIRKAVGQRAAMYSLYPSDVLSEVNPRLKSWLDGSTPMPDAE
jgi:DNA-binding MarR family transcriptional regulator